MEEEGRTIFRESDYRHTCVSCLVNKVKWDINQRGICVSLCDDCLRDLVSQIERKGLAMEVKMHFYYHKDHRGRIHVQNAVMGYLGQHHVHTPEEFEEWKKGISEDCLHEGPVDDCNCGLEPGEARSHDGHLYQVTKMKATQC
jgi:hypothetical protein